MRTRVLTSLIVAVAGCAAGGGEATPGTAGGSRPAAPAGARGDAGASGAGGTSGSAGAPGPAGASGIAGTPGVGGAAGTPGVAGGPGVAGAPGVAGTPGVAGRGGAGLAGAPGGAGATGTGPYVWKNVAVGGGGFVTGVVFHPAQAGLLYARTDIGGAYRWNAASASWTSITDAVVREQADTLGVLALAVDPGDANKVYLMTGKYTQSWAGTGWVLASRESRHELDAVDPQREGRR